MKRLPFGTSISTPEFAKLYRQSFGTFFKHRVKYFVTDVIIWANVKQRNATTYGRSTGYTYPS